MGKTTNDLGAGENRFPPAAISRRRCYAALGRIAADSPVTREAAGTLGLALITIAKSKDPEKLADAAKKLTATARKS